MIQETCFGSYDFDVAEKKWYSEYNCNCQDKNGQKHYDDQHQV